MTKKLRIIALLSILLMLNSCNMFITTGSSKDSGDQSSNITTDIEDVKVSITHKGKISLNVGKGMQLAAEVSGTDDASIIWESSAPNIVSINSDGYITAKKVGEATIYATSEADTSVSDSIDVKVVANNSSTDPTPDPDEIPNPDKNKYKLYWHDEFDGTSLNTDYWEYMEGDGSSYGNPGWGNNEAQYYAKDNLKVADGLMTITARKESKGNKNYTSSRIRTAGKVFNTYGRIEARMKLPAKTGLWPAFWLLPEPNSYGYWPNSGEIDIMEAKGRLPNESSGAIHYANKKNQHNYLTGTADYKHLQGEQRIDSWHTFALEWDKNEINFYVDEFCFFGAKNSDFAGVEGSNGQPFDKNFHVLFNLAVGGMFDNYQMPADSDLPSSMQVDWVRWWSLKD